MQKQPSASGERFTIADMGLITLSSACALFVALQLEKKRLLLQSPQSPHPPFTIPWEMLWMSLCFAAIFTAGGFSLRRRWRGKRIGSFCVLALSMWAGLLIQLPLEWLGQNNESPNIRWSLEYAWPLMCCWWWLAGVCAGRITKRGFSRVVPWSEKCAMIVSGLFGLWGVWTVIRIYLMTLGF